MFDRALEKWNQGTREDATGEVRAASERNKQRDVSKVYEGDACFNSDQKTERRASNCLRIQAR